MTRCHFSVPCTLVPTFFPWYQLFSAKHRLLLLFFCKTSSFAHFFAVLGTGKAIYSRLFRVHDDQLGPRYHHVAMVGDPEVPLWDPEVRLGTPRSDPGDPEVPLWDLGVRLGTPRSDPGDPEVGPGQVGVGVGIWGPNPPEWPDWPNSSLRPLLFKTPEMAKKCLFPKGNIIDSRFLYNMTILTIYETFGTFSHIYAQIGHSGGSRRHLFTRLCLKR